MAKSRPSNPTDRFRYRLAAAERHLERAQAIAQATVAAARRAKNKPAKRRRQVLALARNTAAEARTIASFKLRRLWESPGRLWDRIRTPKPALSEVSDDSPFLVVGHRGAARQKVENTIESFDYAIHRGGANAIELDLCMTKDGVVVVWHDWYPNEIVAVARQLGLEPNVRYQPRTPPLWSSWRRPTHELTLAELREHYGFQRRIFWFWKKVARVPIPTFAEFVQWAVNQPKLRAVFLDTKIPDDQVHLVPAYMEQVHSLLSQFNARFESVFMTPRAKVLAAMKQAAPKARYSYDIEVPPGFVSEPTKWSGTRAAIENGNVYASVGRPAMTLGAWRIYQAIIENDVKLRSLHNGGQPNQPVERLIGWTINVPGETERLIRLGVQGLLTDDPKKLRKLALKCGRKLA